MILNYLKKNTASIHQQIEKDNLAKYILDHSISKEDYKKLLIQNFEFYHTIEQALNQQKNFIHAGFHSFLTDKKTQSLKKDLVTLDTDIDLDTFQKYSYQIDSQNAAIGALYVSEGSALGGIVISKHLSSCPKLNTLKKHHFFGNDVSVFLGQWKNFRQTVEEHFNHNGNKEEILQSAIKTFQLFGQIMRE